MQRSLTAIIAGMLATAGIALAPGAGEARTVVAVGVGVPLGLPYYYAPPPAYYYPPPLYVAPAPAPIYMTPPVQGAPPPQFYYYCDNPQGYYPYVPNCSGPWRQVSPSPAQPAQPGQ